MTNLFLLALEFALVSFGLPLLIFYGILPNLPISHLLVAGLGGVTYGHSGSLRLTGLDYALFGNFILVIGRGRFFYHGSRIPSL
jgi:hypothetical protein